MSDTEHDTTTPVNGSGKQSAPQVISTAIKKAESEIRKQYPFLHLKYQDLCSVIIFSTAWLINICCWYYYFQRPYDYKRCALVILVVAHCTSWLHELEHDLIHNQYFKKYLIVQDLMFFGIWIGKLHGNPWYRREMHLKHHILSGQVDDAEERLIGLGIPFGWLRIAISMHPLGMLIVTKDVKKDCSWLDVRKMNLSSAPVVSLFFIMTKLWFLYLGFMFYFGDDWIYYLPLRHWWWIRASAICICLPNMLRQFCLQTMSNCSHYYGDIPEKSVFYQNQIMDHWIIYPFQLFCMNFASTHIVHHYIPGQPFYIRELVYLRVKKLMIEQGVRYNDFGTVMRANSYYNKDSKDENKKEIEPNNSNFHVMVAWLIVVTIVGSICWIIFDTWATWSMLQRIYKRYFRPSQLAAEENPKEKSI